MLVENIAKYAYLKSVSNLIAQWVSTIFSVTKKILDWSTQNLKNVDKEKLNSFIYWMKKILTEKLHSKLIKLSFSFMTSVEKKLLL